MRARGQTHIACLFENRTLFTTGADFEQTTFGLRYCSSSFGLGHPSPGMV